MRPDPSGRATHDDVGSTRRERRVIARFEADLGLRDPVRSDPAALLVVGLVVLVVGGIATSGILVVLGILFSLGALVRAGLSS